MQGAACRYQRQGHTHCRKVPPAAKAAASTAGRKTWAALATVCCRALFLPLLKLHTQTESKQDADCDAAHILETWGGVGLFHRRCTRGCGV
jgi:hypothetical protein